MSASDMGSLALTLGVLVVGAHLLGYFFERLRQPPLIGEILAGVLLGPFVLAHLAPEISSTIFGTNGANDVMVKIVLHFIYWLGLLLLMFIAGSDTRRLMAPENHRPLAWLLGIGIPLPFFFVIALAMTSLLPLDSLTGKAGNPTSAMLVLAISVAVTSIPVLSRIFYDIGILQTRFAGLILSFAVIEDIVLWGVLAVATSLVGYSGSSSLGLLGHMGAHVGASLIYMAIGLWVAPVALRRLHRSPWNFLAARSPIAYILSIMLVYAAIASAMDVTVVFAAFLAGFGIVGGIGGHERPRFATALDSLAKVSMAFFIPIYFAMVGYRLVFGQEFSLGMLLIFIIGSTALCLVSIAAAARLAGFRGLDIINLAIVKNARGGPGIVLASVAYEQGIINAGFYTTLVLTALLTSQAAGAWLRFILSRGWPLLSTGPSNGAINAPAPADLSFVPPLEIERR